MGGTPIGAACGPDWGKRAAPIPTIEYRDPDSERLPNLENPGARYRDQIDRYLGKFLEIK